MDTQEHEIKKSSSGRESHGVYMCNKCGWPFPKAHPSSKHRRGHKKVCGTIEGYKLLESDDHLVASDGEHAPGEDQRTPSPVVDKRGVKGLGSSGRIGLQSNRSADDVFSDAVAEFSDSAASPAIEDAAKDLSQDMDKLVHSDSVEGKSFGGTFDSSITATQSIKKSNLEVDEHVINQLESTNSSSEARNEDSPVGSIGVTAKQFDTSPVIFETPTDVFMKSIDADVKDEVINKTLTTSLNPNVDLTRESPESYVNEIDRLPSYNLREESVTPVADVEKQSNLDAEENTFLDFVNQHILVENGTSPPQKHPDTENSVTEFDGKKSDEESEVQRIVEQSGEGKDINVSLAKVKEKETTVSNLKEQTEADIAVYSLSVPDSLAGIANAAHLIENFKDYASSAESSLPLDLWSVGGQTVPGFSSVDSSGGMNSSTADQNILEGNLNEKEVEKPITDNICVSGSTEESVKDHGSCSLNTQPKAPRAEAKSAGIYDLSAWDHDWMKKLDSETNELNIMSPVLIENSEETDNHVGGDDPDQIKMSKVEESDEDIKQCSKSPIEDQLAANDKRTQGTGSLLSEDNQIDSSLKVHQSQVLEEAVVELSGHESTGPTQKCSDENVQQSAYDSRGKMEQIAYKLSQNGTGNVTDDTGSVASAVKIVEGNHNDWIMLSSENQGEFITNEVGPLHVGSESLQGKGDEKLETRNDDVAVSIASSSQADGSIDGNWGSVSVVSLQLDTAATADAGAPSENSQNALQTHNGAAENDSVKSDDFELPSSMTLVEPGSDVPQRAAQSDLSALSTQQQKDGDQMSIAKGSNLSTRKEHSPLISLLGEAKSPNSKQSSYVSSKSSGAAVTTVDAILRSEPNDKDIEKEWDSPAKYPAEIKKEKRRRKPYWVPFVCCSSVQRDL